MSNLNTNLQIVPAKGPVDFRSGHSLSAGRSWSLLGACACGVSSDLSIPQESSALHSNQQEAINLKYRTHFFKPCYMKFLLKGKSKVDSLPNRTGITIKREKKNGFIAQLN
ncbi:hypothetical protein IEC97_01905 [Neobacillus cucumis]|uniref:hypothetical protein n=1 Tax=Neobacillus cucumis TaxID=1740721 RepID=UPI0018DFFE64|nr:hypothetical protein [Neobacillus cucumis]MBI0576100.1 hypothetical protein [Neobacillus cucumis]